MKLYTSPTCGKCKVIKKLLEEKNISFEELDTSEDFKAQAYLASIGRMALPVVVRDDGSVMSENLSEIMKEINQL
jgi:glutaredoxin